MFVVGYLYPPSSSIIIQSRMQGLRVAERLSNNKNVLGSLFIRHYYYNIFFKKYKKKLPEISGSFLLNNESNNTIYFII